MAPKQPAVYIMASAERGALYIGVTGNLKLRVWEHREDLVKGFTQRYDVKRLVWVRMPFRFSFSDKTRKAA
ncbi:GIY-YIG nuclease family protein [Dyella caseinilytica]|uniref:GIY-YIG nuclease family protein n=1 Tax=Dyella caseinilytica TaxID=1849581 RepID=UPI0019B6A66E|nr:GIY-YIG nuclease family protein [Dyella caseinilytica]GGA04438.1 hypothetical protein GCM10011408_27830 [Dyella caseinilytica]